MDRSLLERVGKHEPKRCHPVMLGVILQEHYNIVPNSGMEASQMSGLPIILERDTLLHSRRTSTNRIYATSKHLGPSPGRLSNLVYSEFQLSCLGLRCGQCSFSRLFPSSRYSGATGDLYRFQHFYLGKVAILATCMVWYILASQS
ncbi:hypothetical protein BJX62DRAFT_215449 [Aspergillus germanicus]